MPRPILLVAGAGDLNPECLAVFSAAEVQVFESLEMALPAIQEEKFQDDGVLFMRSDRRPEGFDFHELILILPLDVNVTLEDYEDEVNDRGCIGVTHQHHDEIAGLIRMFQGCLN